MVYALQAVSFFLGITYLVAIALNYAKMESVGGTLQESHFRWQMRTFWLSILGTVVGLATCGLLIGYPILLGTCVWVIYRISVGWLALRAGNEVNPTALT
ncbi:MAG: hypothetical protein COB53_10810 [Elusimicrobia bacterium]|nr:MAG: hypothetical protein COB53_10810 [Elusimicrobiota bacterium]